MALAAARQNAPKQNSMTWQQLLAWGCLGGVILEFLAVAEYRRVPPDQLPSWLKAKFYWTVSVGMIGLGGLAAAGSLPHGIITNWWAPVQVGMAFPALFNVSNRIGSAHMGSGTHD
jgi:hypothetical protein